MSVSAVAQASNAAHVEQTSSDAGKKKEVKFEVVSIRPRKGFPHFITYNPTPVGFTSSLTALQMIMLAYAPGASNAWGSIPMINAPSWLGDFYDIDARVSNDDLV